MNFDVGNAPFAVDYLKWFHVRIKLLPLTGPVGTNLFFPNHTPAFRCLGPADVLTHERQGAVNVSLVKSGVGLSYQCLCVCHESSTIHSLYVTHKGVKVPEGSLTQKVTFLGQISKAREKQNFLDDCRIPVRPFDDMVKAGQPARPQTVTEDRYTRPLHRRMEKSCHSI